MKSKRIFDFAKTVLFLLFGVVLFLSCKKDAEAEAQQTVPESQAVAVAAAQEPKDETEQKKTESENLSLPERMTTDYSKVNFDEYQKKDYEYDGTGYYEKYYVYYKSYFYDDEETGETRCYRVGDPWRDLQRQRAGPEREQLLGISTPGQRDLGRGVFGRFDRRVLPDPRQ